MPVPGDDGTTRKDEATAATLRNLLDPLWLSHNDAAIELLTRHFGFDALELRLLGASPDADVRQELRDGLARLLEVGGANPEIYAGLARELEERRQRSEDVERCRSMGLAVQNAIGRALEIRGLKVTLVDRGFDYEVALQTGDVDEASLCFEVGPYLLEVKATTTGEVKMTPTQAETAAREAPRYVLCVVDLRQGDADAGGGTWTALDVEPLARLVPNIGNSVRETWELVEWARGNEVAIRNDKALRYGVPARVWVAGISISDWVEQISSALRLSL